VKHTPLFSCITALGAVVHLSAFVLSYDPAKRTSIRGKLALSTGALKQIGDTWRVAQSVLGTIQAAAREIILSRGRLPTLDSSIGAGKGAIFEQVNGLYLEDLQDPFFLDLANLGTESVNGNAS
jgi:hypothetical protein